jgi:hypothetical protein
MFFNQVTRDIKFKRYNIMPYVIKTETSPSILITDDYNVPPDLYNIIIGDASKAITVTFPELSAFTNSFEIVIYNNSPHDMTVVYGASSSDVITPLTTKKYIVLNNSLFNVSSTGSGFDPSGYLKLDGTNGMVGAFNMGNNKIVNVGNPTSAQDVATKNHVDQALSGLNALYLNLDGTNAMSGALNMGASNKIVGVADPVAAQDAATKAYVDSLIATAVSAVASSCLKLDGTVPMAAPFNMGTNKITNVGNPTAAQDAATKVYVDSIVNLKLDGTTPMTGALNMGTSNKIANVANPTSSQDAATKGYVDALIVSNIQPSLYLSGTTPMTDDLNMGANKIVNVANPTAAQDAATKSYVDGSKLTYNYFPLIPKFDFVSLDPLAPSFTSTDGYVVSSSIATRWGFPFIWWNSNEEQARDGVTYTWTPTSGTATLFINFKPPRPMRFYAVGFYWTLAPVGFTLKNEFNGTSLIETTALSSSTYTEFNTTTSDMFPELLLSFFFPPNSSGSTLKSLQIFSYNT